MKLTILTLASGLGFFGVAGPAPAADLGGDCCADLEARVATLEATTVNKGNRKVHLTITGVVDESILWGTRNNGGVSQTYIMANPNDAPEVDINADASFGKDWHIGSSLEIAIDQQRPGSTHDGHIDTHQVYVYVSNGMAKLELGAIDEASKGLEEEGVVNLRAVAPGLDVSSLAAWATSGFFTSGEIFGGSTSDGVKLELTPVAGLTISGSYHPEVGTDAIKDVAVRWTTLIGKTLLVSAGAGYHMDDATTDKVFKANAGIEETVSGLFVQGSYGRDDLFAVTGWQVQAGIDKNMLGMIGKTDVYAEYGQLNGISGTTAPRLYGVGMQQNVDAAAALFYAGYRHYDATDAAGDTADTVLAGLKVKF